MANNARKTHVSPGFYSREMIEEPYIEENVGITSLGVVGETLKGPAFEPTKIKSWEDFVDKFGGTNPEVFEKSKYPRYELPYIAESYLSQSQQLNVCRVLGMSGYNAGPAWAITAHRVLPEESTETETDQYVDEKKNMVVAVLRSRAYYVDYEKYTTEKDVCIPPSYDRLHFYVGEMTHKPEDQYVSHFNPSAITLNDYRVASPYGNECSTFITGTSGNLSYVELEGGEKQSGFTVSYTDFGKFSVNGFLGEAESYGQSSVSAASQNFTYSVSLNPADSNYILKVFGTDPQNGNTPLYVETLFDVALARGIERGEIDQINQNLVFYDVCYPADLATIPPVDGFVEKEEGGLRKDDVGKRLLYAPNYAGSLTSFHHMYCDNGRYTLETRNETVTESVTVNGVVKEVQKTYVVVDDYGQYDMEDGNVYTVKEFVSNVDIYESGTITQQKKVIVFHKGKKYYLYTKIADKNDSRSDFEKDKLIGVEDWETNEVSRDPFKELYNKNGVVINNTVIVYNKADGFYYTQIDENSTLIPVTFTGMFIDGEPYQGNLKSPTITSTISKKKTKVVKHEDGTSSTTTSSVTLNVGYVTNVKNIYINGSSVTVFKDSMLPNKDGYIVRASDIMIPSDPENMASSNSVSATCTVYKAVNAIDGVDFTYREVYDDNGHLISANTTPYAKVGSSLGEGTTAIVVLPLDGRTPQKGHSYNGGGSTGRLTNTHYFFQTSLKTYPLFTKSSAIYNTGTTYTELGGTMRVTCDLNNYKEQFRCATTPWIVSNVKGDYSNLEITRLFRCHTINDGKDTSNYIKISITNINLDKGTFTLQVRDINDMDSNPIILESFSNCTLVPNSPNYIAYQIGSTDGNFERKSKYITVEVNDTTTVRNSIPAGFLGYPTHHFTGIPFVEEAIVNPFKKDGEVNVSHPKLQYNTTYYPSVNNKKQYFGLSDIEGIDVDFFTYKGVAAYYIDDPDLLTRGFHLDARLNRNSYSGDAFDYVSITVDGEIGYRFDTVDITNHTEDLRETPIIGTEEEMQDCIYNNENLRKFTVYFYGGFDGWDEHRRERTVYDDYMADKYKGRYNKISGEGFAFRKIFNPNTYNLPSNSISSDWYAFLRGARQYSDSESIQINVLATPGFDCLNSTRLCESVIDMVEEERGDTFYVMTLPDKPRGASDGVRDMYEPYDIVEYLEETNINSSYASVYYPWVKYDDTTNSRYIFLPPTKDVVRNIAITDNSAQPWFAPAGMDRGSVECVAPRRLTTLQDEDLLYNGRINPIKTFAYEGVRVWGQKNLQYEENMLNRISIRRLLLRMKKLIANACIGLIFDVYDDDLVSKVVGAISNVMSDIQSNRGISDYKIETDSSAEAKARYELPCKVWFRPYASLEYIAIDFILTQNGLEMTSD